MLEENPTEFVGGIIRKSGIEVPKGFQVHTLNVGESLPDEPTRGTEDREFYVFHPNGRIEPITVKGVPDGNAEIHETDPEPEPTIFCNCGGSCCIIFC